MTVSPLHFCHSLLLGLSGSLPDFLPLCRAFLLSRILITISGFCCRVYINSGLLGQVVTEETS